MTAEIIKPRHNRIVPLQVCDPLPWHGRPHKNTGRIEVALTHSRFKCDLYEAGFHSHIYPKLRSAKGFACVGL